MEKKKTINTTDQLVQLGIINDTNGIIRITKKFIDMENKYIRHLMNKPRYFEDLQKSFPNDNEEEIAKRCIDQASILAILDMMGKKGNQQELENCAVVIKRIHEIQEKES